MQNGKQRRNTHRTEGDKKSRMVEHTNESQGTEMASRASSARKQPKAMRRRRAEVDQRRATADHRARPEQCEKFQKHFR